MSKVNWSEKDEKYWVKNLKGENLFFESSLDAKDAARQIEIDTAVKAERDRYREALGHIQQVVEDSAYCVRADTPKSPFTEALNEIHGIAETALSEQQP